MMLMALDKNGSMVQKTAGSARGWAAMPAAERNPMTLAAIDGKHTEETLEKKEKKLNFSGSWEIRDLFDGIDSDLRITMILNGRL
jgi:hypothetical protein